MRTGEGKTLVATLPLYLNALTGRGTHLITVNDYLARYQARWMAQIYNFLGLSVGLLQMAASTENGKKAYLVDLSKESPREDQHQIRLVDRRLAYEADITYGTNAESVSITCVITWSTDWRTKSSAGIISLLWTK